MKTLFIMSAGNQSRFKENIPKSLANINGKPNLINTIEKVEELFDDIYVFIDEQSRFIYETYFLKYKVHNKVKLRSIISGQGSGHAIMQALRTFSSTSQIPDVSILWGDTYIENTITMREMLDFSLTEYNMIIPVIKAQEPYVAVEVDENMQATGVAFSKYGDTKKWGFWDRSMFRISGELLYNSVHSINRVISTSNGSYITSSNEFEFLYIINYLCNIKLPATCFVTQFGSEIKSYNTIEEVKIIEKETK